MTKIALVVSDVDGTLVTHDKRLTDAVATPPTTPPIAPSTVFFGLTAGANLRRPKVRPTR